MRTLSKKSNGYTGGSLRDRSTPQITFTPKIYDQQNIDTLLTSLKTLYIENKLQPHDLEFIVEYLEEFKTTQNYTGSLEGNIIAGRLILTLEGMWADGKIDNNYLDSIIEGIKNIKLKSTPKPTKVKVPKEQLNFNKNYKK